MFVVRAEGTRVVSGWDTRPGEDDMSDFHTDPWQPGASVPPPPPAGPLFPPLPPPPLLPPPPPPVGTATRLRGVRGWLLFFCLTLVLFYPGARLYELIQVVPVYSRLFSRFPGLFLVTLFLVAMNVGIAGFSVYAGVMLLRLRPSAVQRTKVFLISAGAYVILVAFAPLLAGLPQAANDIVLNAALPTIGSGLAYAGIWLAYVTASKRVRATYATDPAPMRGPPPAGGMPLQ